MWIRRAALVSFLLAALPASAGDYADREFIGFSADGAYFAFEEYGIQDGSGFPYVNIYVIDIAADGWLAGTPIRVVVEDESAPLAQVRAEARRQAQPLLARFDLTHSGRLLASNPVTEVSADPHAVSFLPRIITPLGGDPASLRLFERTLPAVDCPDIGEPFKGFRLDLEMIGLGTRRLAEDMRIPSSRKCPLGYGISDVLSFPPEGEPEVLVVIINVFSVGFEGPDRRFLAVTTRLR